MNLVRKFASVALSFVNITKAELEERLGLNDLSNISLPGVNFTGAELPHVDLRFSDFRGATFKNAQLNGVQLRDANLRGADFRWSNMKDADLRGAKFNGADLTGADLMWADLRNADFTGATLIDIKLTGAPQVKGAKFSYESIVEAGLDLKMLQDQGAIVVVPGIRKYLSSLKPGRP